MTENQTIMPPNSGLANNFGNPAVSKNSAEHDQEIERNVADRISKEVDNAFMTAKIRVHNAILTAMDNVIIISVEMAVKFVTGSSGCGPNIVVKNPDQRNVSVNTKNNHDGIQPSRLKHWSR